MKFLVLLNNVINIEGFILFILATIFKLLCYFSRLLWEWGNYIFFNTLQAGYANSRLLFSNS